MYPRTSASPERANYRLPPACRLRGAEVVGRHGPMPHWRAVELENLSADPVEIPHEMTELQHLDLEVCSGTRVVSEGHFGDRFAPTAEPRTLRLEPGGKFAAKIYLFSTFPQRPLPPGTYTITATYLANGFRAASEPLRVTV